LTHFSCREVSSSFMITACKGAHSTTNRKTLIKKRRIKWTDLSLPRLSQQKKLAVFLRCLSEGYVNERNEES
jgi:hypothetical protein